MSSSSLSLSAKICNKIRRRKRHNDGNHKLYRIQRSLRARMFVPLVHCCFLVPGINLAWNILSKYLLNEYNTFQMHKNMLLDIRMSRLCQGWITWEETEGGETYLKATAIVKLEKCACEKSSWYWRQRWGGRLKNYLRSREIELDDRQDSFKNQIASMY